jgi:type II secretory pathway predicted ATPase ExeA
MDREGVIARANATPPRPEPADAWVLPSREQALAHCREWLEAEAGPVLVTGDAGAGKTWLWRRLAATDPTPRRWLGIELSPPTTPDDLFRAIGHALGLADTGPTSARRLALADFLAERAADGERCALVIDEAHNLSDTLLEEVRLLSNRLGQDDGFAALFLIGQTRLAQRLNRHALAGLAARIAARVHLGPIDADEALVLLERRSLGRDWGLADAERLHRDAGGNPQRLLRLAAFQRPSSLERRPTPAARPSLSVDLGPSAAQVAEEVAATTPPSPLLGPSKPPIRDEEGLIEVGWEEEPSDQAPTEIAKPQQDATPGAGPSQETIEDHYAALQAWNEWSRNQGRAPAEAPPAHGTLGNEPDPESEVAEEELRADAWPASEGRAQVWADGPDRFAPYSQLFSRLKPSKGID